MRGRAGNTKAPAEAGTDAVYRDLLIFIFHGMEGKEPIPISRGVEIQAEKMKEIKEWALARHAEITRLGAIVEERRERGKTA